MLATEPMQAAATANRHGVLNPTANPKTPAKPATSRSASSAARPIAGTGAVAGETPVTATTIQAPRPAEKMIRQA